MRRERRFICYQSNPDPLPTPIRTQTAATPSPSPTLTTNLTGNRQVNFMVYYEGDDTVVPHHLSVLTYDPDPEAGPNSWYLLVEVEDEQE